MPIKKKPKEKELDDFIDYDEEEDVDNEMLKDAIW